MFKSMAFALKGIKCNKCGPFSVQSCRKKVNFDDDVELTCSLFIRERDVFDLQR